MQISVLLVRDITKSAGSWSSLPINEGLPLARRHNVDLLGCDNTGSVLRFVVVRGNQEFIQAGAQPVTVVLPCAIVGRSVGPKIGIPCWLRSVPRKSEDWTRVQ